MAIYRCALQKRFDDVGNPLCTYEAAKPWKGRCGGCGRLCGFFKVGVDAKALTTDLASAAAATTAAAIIDYIPTGIANFDEVVGGGLVKGQLIQFVGPSGSGKSRLAMQICQSMAARIEQPFLFASAEETVPDVTRMCRSVGATSDRLKIIGTETFDTEYILQVCDKIKPALLVIDSLQAADGWSVNSVIAPILKEYCDRTGQCALVMNHAAKDLSAKGSTTVGHMFKATIYMYEYESSQDGKVEKTFGKRFLKRVKNGEIRLVDIRTLMSGKNRSGGSGLKAFFIFDSDGKLVPLQKKSAVIVSSDEDDDEDEDEGGDEGKSLEKQFKQLLARD